MPKSVLDAAQTRWLPSIVRKKVCCLHITEPLVGVRE